MGQRSGRAARRWGALLTSSIAVACAGRLPAGPGPAPIVPVSPAATVELEPPPPPPERPAPRLPENWEERASSLTLAEVVDVALGNNPATRETWAQALAAAAELGETRSAYYPDLEFGASVSRAKQAAVAGRFAFVSTVYGPSLSLGYLLLDFGGRKGDAEEALEALRAADWEHNAAVQDVVLAVQVRYYQYQSAKAQLEAADSNVREAQANLEAATTRQKAGVATVAEVLQARTAASQAELVRQSFEGGVLTLLGALATAMGLRADTAIEVGMLPDDVPSEAIGETVDALIDRALTRRPELQAARARVLAQDGAVRSAHSDRLPTLELSASANRSYYDPATFVDSSDNWSAAVLLSFPLFSGFEREYAERRAAAERDAARARSEAVEYQVIDEVWRSYHGLRTAAKRVQTSRDLLASADESEKVALARYKEGVGSILDLLTAQSSLALARALEIEARSDWFIALAQLARDTGTLSPPQAAGHPSGGPDGD